MPSSHLSLKRLYNHYNRKYFNGELPADLPIIWEPLDQNAGLTTIVDGKPIKISIDPVLSGLTRYTKIVLLHEMIHVKIPRATHGRVFKTERQRLWDLGAFDRLI